MLNEGPKTPKPAEFAASIAESDGYELAAAQTALAQSRTAQVREFADHMLAVHARLSRALGDATKSSGLEAPRPHVGGDQSRFLAGLQSLRGDAFDREYARQQVLAHTSALTTMRSYAKKGTDANLRRFADASIAAIESHLEAARQLMQAVGR